MVTTWSGSLFLPCFSRKVYQPVRSLPLNRGVQCSSWPGRVASWTGIVSGTASCSGPGKSKQITRDKLKAVIIVVPCSVLDSILLIELRRHRQELIGVVRALDELRHRKP